MCPLVVNHGARLHRTWLSSDDIENATLQLQWSILQLIDQCFIFNFLNARCSILKDDWLRSSLEGPISLHRN